MKLYSIIMLILSFIFIAEFANAELCQDETFLSSTPCIVVTPVLACSTNATITNLATSQTYNHSMTLVGAGVYNFTFNYSLGSYNILLCDLTTGSVEVIADSAVVDYSLGGGGISNPDPRAVVEAVKEDLRNEIDKKVNQWGKTTKMLFWLSIIGIIFGVLAFFNFKKRRLDKLTQKVADKLNFDI